MRIGRKRLIQGAIAVVVLGVGALALRYEYQRIHVKRIYYRWRAEGIAASRAGQHRLAVEDLRGFLSQYLDDPEALRAYIYSRPRTEVPGDQPQAQQDTIFALRQLIRLETDTVADRRKLIEFCQRAGQNTEASDAADDLLSIVPNDPQALAAKVIALEMLQKWDEAFPIARQWADAAPLDVQAQMTAVFLLPRMKAPPEKPIERATALRAAHPGDPRFEFLEGFALANSPAAPDALHASQAATSAEGKTEVEWFRAAAAHPVDDPAFVRALVGQFDALGLFDDSLALMRHAYQANPISPVARDLFCRLWEMNAWTNIVAVYDPKNTDAEVTAIEAVALNHVGRQTDAARLRTQLAGLGDDASAKAWGLVIDQPARPTRADLQKVIDACNVALDQDSADAPLHFLCGVAHAQLRNTISAIGELKAAAMAAPPWPLPLSTEAEIRLGRGEIGAALAASETARRRASREGNIDDLSIAITLARVALAARTTGHALNADELRALAQSVQKIMPGEESTLELLVTLAKDHGHLDEARSAVTAVLDSSRPQTEHALVRMAAISEATGLGVEDGCFERSRHDHGLTATLAFAQAAYLFRHGKKTEGLALLDEGSRTGVDPKSSAWPIAYASFLEVSGDSGAVASWKKLADDFPADLVVQRAVLSSPAATDRTLQERTIDRLHHLEGEQAIDWRLARAQWLLADPNAPTAHLDEASALIEGVLQVDAYCAEAHWLSGRILQRRGDRDNAINQLRIASDLNPASAQITLELVPLLTGPREVAELRDRLVRVAEGPAPTPEALSVLGWLQQKDGRRLEAEASYRRALQFRPNFAPVQNNLAMVLLTGNDQREIQEAISLGTAATKAEPKNPKYLDTLGQAQKRAGDLESALKTLERAITLDPKDPLYRLNQVDCLIATGRQDEARSALSALKSLISSKPDIDSDLKERLTTLSAQLETK